MLSLHKNNWFLPYTLECHILTKQKTKSGNPHTMIYQAQWLLWIYYTRAECHMFLCFYSTKAIAYPTLNLRMPFWPKTKKPKLGPLYYDLQEPMSSIVPMQVLDIAPPTQNTTTFNGVNRGGWGGFVLKNKKRTPQITSISKGHNTSQATHPLSPHRESAFVPQLHIRTFPVQKT